MTDHIETNVISENVNEVFPNILKQLEKVQEVERKQQLLLSCTIFRKRALFILL